MTRKLCVSLIKIMIFMEMDASTIDKGMKTVQPRVIEGFSATEGVFTWMVALYFKGTYVCSASLISDRLVLTAAHCIVHDNILQKAEDFIGHMGSVNKSFPTLRVEFHSLRIHPEYNSKNLTADVALMVTKQKINLEEFGSVKRICLFAEAKEKKREMLGMGWGSTSALLAIIPETLQITWLSVIQNIFCSVVQWTMTNETLCMGAINKGICQIDEAPISLEETESERIIGGSDAVAGQFPYAGALHYNNRFICTSSIISPTTIMTAAHCVKLNGRYQPANRFYVIANVSRVAQSVRVEIERVIPHPDYNDRSIDNDIAILKTKEPIPFSDEVGPVCIARPDTDPMQYRNATAIGWGNNSRMRFITTIPETLQYVEQRIVQNTMCSLLFTPGVNENKICAMGKFTGVCNGDSGGPLVHLSNLIRQPVQIGIASYINGLVGCGKLTPAAWTRVSSYYDFIMQSAEDSSICVV